jgi:hypothetical protein
MPEDIEVGPFREDRNLDLLLAAEQVAADWMKELRKKLQAQFPKLDPSGADVIMLRVLGKRAGRLRYEADVVKKVVMEAYSAGYKPYNLLASVDNFDPEVSGYNPFLPFHERTTRQPEPERYDPEFEEEFGSDKDWGFEREIPVPISIFKLEDDD